MEIRMYLESMKKSAETNFKAYKKALEDAKKLREEYENFKPSLSLGELQNEYDKNNLRLKKELAEDKANKFDFSGLLREVENIKEKVITELDKENTVDFGAVKAINVDALRLLSALDLVSLYNQSTNYSEKEIIYRILATERKAETESNFAIRGTVNQLIWNHENIGEDEVSLIDSMVDVIKRCVNNKAMIDSFEVLTAPLFEE